jgi:hypothetical protein
LYHWHSSLLAFIQSFVFNFFVHYICSQNVLFARPTMILQYSILISTACFIHFDIEKGCFNRNFSMKVKNVYINCEKNSSTILIILWTFIWTLTEVKKKKWPQIYEWVLFFQNMKECELHIHINSNYN